MTRTYSHDKFKKQDCGKGRSMARKTQKQKIMKFDILPVIDLYID